MRPIPANAQVIKTTPHFTESTIAPGLLGRHMTPAGTWGRIRVLQGSLVLRYLEPEVSEQILSPEVEGVIEPQRPHQVEAREPVRFFVELLREPDAV